MKLKLKFCDQFEFKQNCINIETYDENKLKEAINQVEKELKNIINDIEYPNNWQFQ